MPKFTERIALERFNFVNVEADTFAELVETVKKVKEVYSGRLHKENEPGAVMGQSSPIGNTLPPAGANACKTCHAVMLYKTGTSKKNGKPWQAYMCPNAKQGVPGHDPIWVR